MNLIRRISTIVIFAFAANTVFAQKTWDLKTLEKANTAKNISYLTIEEKKSDSIL